MSLLLLFPAAEQIAPVTSTGAFAQTGTWASTASERIPASAAFTQVGSWAASASSIQPIASTATFAQAATWAGQGKSLLAVTGTVAFSQSASWFAEGTHTDLAVAATASFTQARVMAGVTGTVQLRIMGYASRAIPANYSQATGTPIELEVP